GTGWADNTGSVSGGYVSPTNPDYTYSAYAIKNSIYYLSQQTAWTTKNLILSVGGYNLSQYMDQAGSGAGLAQTAADQIAKLVQITGAVGVDLDYEPVGQPCVPANMALLCQKIQIAVKALNPTYEVHLTIIPPLSQADPDLKTDTALACDPYVDQINVMTYDLSGAYSGWVTWFNAPLYNGGLQFPGTSRFVPSTDEAVSNFIAGGVAPGKLGIGIAFYGYVWSGGTGTSTGGAALPRQSWTSAPTTTAPSYDAIMTTYYQPSLYHWDTNAQAAYLSLDNPNSANDKFISYDDEHTCQAKVSYARNRGLGGLMIWELAEGYRPSQPVGQREPLLQAVKQSLATPCFTGIQTRGSDVQLNFTSLPLANYRILWASDLSANAWSTLSNNVSGTGGTLQIIDTNASPRVYRIQTPP
ncbi:MAG: glycoside hydrolase family 18 protein, partial [bacterium]